MNAEYTPFADKGHVIYSDVKYSGYVPDLCITVKFNSASQVDTLIDSLRLLRDNLDHPRGHVHLQDGHRDSGGYPAEIVFMNAAWFDEGGEADMRALAESEIKAYNSAKKKSV